LRLDPHAHKLVADGVWVQPNEEPTFVPVRPSEGRIGHWQKAIATWQRDIATLRKRLPGN